ncbi:hypothetical protein PY365_25510 [Roseiarcaceae bacterium H3SJ34-1]|uniref:glycine-rich domain-containing protein n=1 Tax=Terripilifer ovatus TaxID=3032367 RepID=UPI003AB95B3A|nr:hypothetical protein [Roseiarcaceae bacterium H3SJ34-1]
MHLESPLWRRLEAFRFDDVADVALPFVARLARDNCWPRNHADRAIGEYRRFLYLACTAGHEVTPSPNVDAVWHLHLVYTRSYWDGLCGDVLQRRLHHGPTRGGSAEGRRYRGNYRRTLESYREAFGAAPPSDIWPDVEARFAPAKLRVVDTDTVWIVRKRGLRRMFAALKFKAWLAGFLIVSGGAALAANGSAAFVSPAMIGGIVAAAAVGMVWWTRLREDKKKSGDSGCGGSGCSSWSSSDSSSSSGQSSSGGDSGGDGDSSGCGGGGCGGGGGD